MSDQSKQLLSIFDMLKQLNIDQKISDNDRSKKNWHLSVLFNQKLQEVTKSSKEEVNFKNCLVKMGFSMTHSDPVTLSGPIPIYADDSIEVMVSDDIAKYCEVCKEQCQKLLKYRWISFRKLERKPLELLISQGLEVGEDDTISVADET